LGLIVSAQSDDRELAGLALFLVDLVQVLLRYREADEHRLQLRDGDESGGVGGAHHVADINHPDAEPATDRCTDIGVAEVEPGRLDLRLVCLERRLQLLHQRLLLIIGLTGLDALWYELGPAYEIRLPAGELRLSARRDSPEQTRQYRCSHGKGKR